MKYDTRSLIKGEIANGIFLFISIYKHLTKVIAASVSEPSIQFAPYYTVYTYFFPPQKKAVLHAHFSDHTIFFWYP